MICIISFDSYTVEICNLTYQKVELERPGREADHFTELSVEVKSGEAILLLQQTP
jgi:hypothetical protein